MGNEANRLAPDGTIRLEPAEQVLLICARPVLDEQLGQELRRLLGALIDWQTLMRAAVRNFMVVLLRKHLLAHAADLIPETVVATLDQLRRGSALRTLEIMRIQHLLAAELLGPPTVPHVFFKGATLSAVYYGDPYLRQYRDIDLLVDDAHIPVVGSKLLARGYVVTNGEWGIFKVPDLVAFCRYNAALEMRSPTGITVELHKTLDNSGCVLPVTEFIRARRAGPFAGAQLHVLPTAELFIYLCFHHSRHKWSSLHWCGDLFAFAEHARRESFQIDELARRLGLEKTLEQCLQLRTDLDALARRGQLLISAASSKFLLDWHMALRGSLTVESADSQHMPFAQPREPDFPYAWQKTMSYRWRFQLSRLHPSANDFNAWPLPNKWHWLYYLLKPARVLRQRLSGSGH